MGNAKELIEGILQQASMMATYYKALLDEGLNPKDALNVAIAYQDSQIKAAVMANIEREKMLMFGQQNSISS